MDKYKFVHDDIIRIIKKIKQQDYSLGNELEKEITFSKKTKSISYSGNALDKIFDKVIITDDNL